jgi:farnesyl-diphosphate farnesyltransferase
MSNPYRHVKIAIVTADQNKDNLAYQECILPEVSRTFALTIPQLPGEQRLAVTNAYLLCRIADTVEDEAALDVDSKQGFLELLTKTIYGRVPAKEFARRVYPALTQSATEAERDLIRNTPRVVAVTKSLNARLRTAVTRCVATMCEGMPYFQRNARLSGLRDLVEMDRYCYYVAGVVGEMLTEVFCERSAAIESQRDELKRLEVSFGQGLQMTNILKDIWEDRARGACWLPRKLFQNFGFNLDDMAPGRYSPDFGAGMRRLVGVAHQHLRDALEYTLLLPSHETGIRRFCLWALGMAVPTLRLINAQPDFSSGQQVKISRRTVKYTVLVTSALARSDSLLIQWFNWTARGLPLELPGALPRMETRPDSHWLASDYDLGQAVPVAETLRPASSYRD